MLKLVKNFVRDESGAAAVEYALVSALIAVVIISGARTIGQNASTAFSRIASDISSTKNSN